MITIDVLLDRADLLLNQGRYKDAEHTIKQALEQEPDNDYALALLGRCYFDAKRYEDGIAVIQQAIAIQPNHDFYFYLLGFGYYQLDKTLTAREQFQQAIALNPYHAEYYGMLAHVLLQGREFEAALDKANEGLAVDAENITCLNARSIALNKLKRTEAAIATMQDALAQDPDNAVTHSTVGWNYLEKGKHREAQKHFMEALRIHPNSNNAKQGLKESLKSKIPPYRWLLQYSFWLHNSGRNIGRYMPIALYIVFRILIGVFNANENTSGIAWALGGIYILFVVTSWSINSIANFFLLFHPLGKHALTNTERWSAISVMSVIISGLALLVASGSGIIMEEEGGSIFIAGILLISLALPLGIIQFPIRLRNKSRGELFTILLLLLGLLTLLTTAISPEVQFPFLTIYSIAFVVYNWTGIGR
jgi:tetratricopeptide (TPR) repeat protein